MNFLEKIAEESYWNTMEKIAEEGEGRKGVGLAATGMSIAGLGGAAAATGAVKQVNIGKIAARHMRQLGELNDAIHHVRKTPGVDRVDTSSLFALSNNKDGLIEAIKKRKADHIKVVRMAKEVGKLPKDLMSGGSDQGATGIALGVPGMVMAHKTKGE